MQRYKTFLKMKRFVTTFFSEIFHRRICLLEVARTGAENLLLSDCNKAKEKDHPKRFISMIIGAKSYSSVKYSEKANISFFVFLSPNSLPQLRIATFLFWLEKLCLIWSVEDATREHCRGNSNEGVTSDVGTNHVML